MKRNEELNLRCKEILNNNRKIKLETNFKPQAPESYIRNTGEKDLEKWRSILNSRDSLGSQNSNRSSQRNYQRVPL